MRQGWWRRNAWGLIGIPLALAVVAGLGWYHAATRDKVPDPTVAVSADQAGWVRYGGTSVRLAGFERVTATDYSGKPLDLGDLKVWKATLDFQLATPTDADGCDVVLEDTAGRTFGNSPAELDRANLHQDRLCSPETSDASAGYQRTMYFVTPADSFPVAVWLTQPTLMPRYANLVVPG